MRNKAFMQIGMLSTLVWLSACGEDDKPKIFPGVDAAATEAGLTDLPQTQLDAAVVEAGQAEASDPQPAAFSSSSCKKESTAKSRLARIFSLNVIDNEAGLDGLRCIAWQRVGTDELRIDLYNFDGSCGAGWEGDGAMVANGTLSLNINNPSCMAANCGSCLYDWSFILHAPVPANQTVPLAIAINICPGTSQPKMLTATIGAETKGIRCTLADYGALNWQASAKSTCGKVGMPCVGSLLCGSGSFTSTGTCDTDMVCDSSAAVNEPRCLVPCASAADCPRTDVWTCQSGLCRPTS
jgi:hypothetical protein